MTRVQELRSTARAAVRDSVPAAVWSRNRAFVQDLIRSIEAHPSSRHPLIEALQAGTFDRRALRAIVLEFHHSFGRLFPEVLLQVMRLAGELEPRLGLGGVSACRFLLQLNLLDELGFDLDGASDPRRAHIAKQLEMVQAVGISEEKRRCYQPSPAAAAVVRIYEAAYGDGARLVPLLAMTEMLSQRFFGPARKTFEKQGVGSVEYLEMHLGRPEGALLDEVHAEDLWYAAIQFVEPDRMSEIRESVMAALDAIEVFLASLIDLAGGDGA